MTLPTNHPDVKTGKIGLLLVNLGTPDDPSTSSVRRYLKEFLSDRRVVNIPRLIWLPILHGIILNTRPKRSAAAYKKIWREDDNESPLRYFTAQQSHQMALKWPDLVVDYAMRYGNPSLSEKDGCDDQARLRPNFGGTALSAILGSNQRFGERCGV